MTHVCPVCGFNGLEQPPRTAGGNGSFEICPSCNFEFGYDDEARGHTYAGWRRAWVGAGMPWNGGEEDPPPADWDPKTQLDEFLAHGDTSEDDVYRGVDPR